MDENDNYYTIPDSIQQINNLFFLYEMNEESDVSSLINYEADQGIITALMKTFSTIEVPELVADINDFIDQLPSQKFDEIMEFFDTMPKLRHIMEVTNPNTKVKSEVVLEGLQNFLG